MKRFFRSIVPRERDRILGQLHYVHKFEQSQTNFSTKKDDTIMA